MREARGIGIRLALAGALLAAAHWQAAAARTAPEALQAAAAAPKALPPLPGWAKPLPRRGPGRDRALAHNKATAAAANAAGRQLDFVLWGDSLTSVLQPKAKYGDTWAKWFGEYASAPMGAPGSTIEDLAYRMMAGGERFTVGPKVIAFLIGTNNDLSTNPAAKLGTLLTWVEQAYPASKLLVIPPPPSWQRRYIPMRDAIHNMLQAHPRVFFSLCGAGLDPSSFDDFKDGVHPVPAGYDIMLRCLKSQVVAALQQKAAG